MSYILAGLFLMALYRFKGDAWPPGWDDTEKRIVWAVGFSIVNFIFNAFEYQETLYAGALPVLAFAAACLPHAQFQSMGRTAGTSFLECFLGMGAIGLVSAAIIFMPSLYFMSDHYVVIKLGLMALGMPLAYTLGYAIPFSIPQVHLRTNTTEWGEFFTGAVYFVAVVL